jgi:hypothetical protein
VYSVCEQLREFFNKGATNFPLQNVIEKISKQPTVIVKALERYFLCNVISGVRHVHSIKSNTAIEKENEAYILGWIY